MPANSDGEQPSYRNPGCPRVAGAPGGDFVATPNRCPASPAVKPRLPKASGAPRFIQLNGSQFGVLSVRARVRRRAQTDRHGLSCIACVLQEV